MLAIMWVMGTEPRRSPRRTTSILNHWAAPWKIIFNYVYALYVCVGVCWHEYSGLSRPEESARSVELVFQTVVSHQIWVLGTKLRTFARAAVLLTANLSLQLSSFFFNGYNIPPIGCTIYLMSPTDRVLCCFEFVLLKFPCICYFTYERRVQYIPRCRIMN